MELIRNALLDGNIDLSHNYDCTRPAGFIQFVFLVAKFFYLGSAISSFPLNQQMSDDIQGSNAESRLISSDNSLQWRRPRVRPLAAWLQRIAGISRTS